MFARYLSVPGGDPPDNGPADPEEDAPVAGRELDEFFKCRRQRLQAVMPCRGQQRIERRFSFWYQVRAQARLEDSGDGLMKAAYRAGQRAVDLAELFSEFLPQEGALVITRFTGVGYHRRLDQGEPK